MIGKGISIVSLLLIFVAMTTTCKKVPAVDPNTGVTDDVLFEHVTSEGLYYYLNDPKYMASDPSSPHDKFMRTNFNAKAASVLGPDGKLSAGKTFPDSSLIVKEISSSETGSLKLYAVMYKIPKASNAGNGWVWAEYKPGGSVETGAGNKGTSCMGCHSSGKNRDLVKIFDLH